MPPVLKPSFIAALPFWLRPSVLLSCTNVSSLLPSRVRSRQYDLYAVTQFARKGPSPMVSLLTFRSRSIDLLAWYVILLFVWSVTAFGQTQQVVLGTQTV